MKKKKRVILSIDGGGVRGLIPLRILESLESRLAHRGVNLPIHKHFDLMCGTSTGGLIIAGLTAPKPDGAKGEAAATIKELRDFYELEAREIFTHSLGKRLARAFINPFNLFDESYDARPLERLLKDRFGWTSIASALTRIVLTAYDIENRQAVFMTNGLEHDGSRPNDYYFWQAVRATTAAPSYFEPARMDNLTSGKQEALIDGGVFMNDPTISAYLEARKLGYAPKDIILVSLGTGQAQQQAYRYEDAIGWGALGWMQPSKGVPILSIFQDGQSQTASYQANELFSELNGVTYFRLNGLLDPGTEAFDNARPGNIIALNGVADRIIRDETVVLDEIADILRDNVPVNGPSIVNASLENAA
ncbi:patatin [Roseibium sp. RKSG952]|nr:patatin [Roseibium sp. RKSG952]